MSRRLTVLLAGALAVATIPPSISSAAAAPDVSSHTTLNGSVLTMAESVRSNHPSPLTGPRIAPPPNRSFLDTDNIRIPMTASGGTLPYTWSAAGLVSANLTIDPNTGVIGPIGFVVNVGTFPVSVTVVDAGRARDTILFDIVIHRECRTC